MYIYTTNKVNIGGDILRYWGDWWRYWGMKDWHHDGCWLLLSLTRELSDIQTRNLYPPQLLTSFTPFSHAVSHFHQRITCEGPFVQCNDYTENSLYTCKTELKLLSKIFFNNRSIIICLGSKGVANMQPINQPEIVNCSLFVDVRTKSR